MKLLESVKRQLLAQPSVFVAEAELYGVAPFGREVQAWLKQQGIDGQPVPDTHVFPTPVGMDRIAAILLPLLRCIPHACGDGPAYQSSAAGITAYSPRLWGWTDIA